MSTATAVPKAAAGARVERFHVNDVQIEGIVTKVWTRSTRSNGSADPDVYARLALYDRYAEVLPPKDNAKSDDLPRRQAHYVTILLPHGRTNDGVPVSLAARNRVRVTGFVREVPYRETLRHILVRSKQIDRIEDDDDDILIQRISTYVVVQTLIRFDA
jgi:hypothetical protein